MSDNKGRLALSNPVYDAAKDTATIYLPGLGAFYLTIAGIWELPYPQQVVGTIVAISTLLGVFLKISTNSYNKSDKSKDGTLIIDQSDPLKDTYRFDVQTPLEQLPDKSTITLKVDTETTPVMDPRLIEGNDSQ